MTSRLTLWLGSTMLVGLFFTAAPAMAQDMSRRLQDGPIVSGSGKGAEPKPAQPPGLPGAALGQDRIAPADKSATSDMQPTDALFDAINRGDIVSARDALSRGADFNAKNVLGLTPLDQSIDLGRNDITFLLLSLRGSSPAPERSAVTPVKAGKGDTRQPPVRAETTAAKKPTPAPRPVAQQAPPRPVAQATSRPGDSGTPNPQTGFLGFGG